MKIRSKVFPLLAITALALVGCGGNSNTARKGSSPTTGWAYNDPSMGGYEVKEAKEQDLGPNLVFIEGGTFQMGQTNDDIYYDWNNVTRRVTIDNFYMDENEVTNVDYREFLFWLRKAYPNYPQVYRNALPDTNVWRRELAFNDPLMKNYLRLPQFNDYPVVGVSWRQANDYCIWRTDRVNELRLIEAGVLKYDPNSQFNTDAYLAGQYEGLVNKNLPSLSSKDGKGTRRVTLEDGILLPQYRLPTEAEWEYAAIALIGNTFDERVVERKTYPWNGHSLRNPDPKNRGDLTANFRRGRGDYKGTAGSANDGYSKPAPVRSFWPNDFNLYDMAGNVNEWVLDVYRPQSSEDVEDFRPFRGNVFTEYLKKEDGTPMVDSLKRLRMDTVKSVNRYNYRKGDNRNIKDGDLGTLLGYENENGSDSVSTTNKMYYPGNNKAKKRPNEGMTSLISDKSRVYKGGSWRDRAYWLIPGTRRYLDENESRDDIGFRCAMESLGDRIPKQTRKK
jgi:gliding motility-associated lipoprotein GldJ